LVFSVLSTLNMRLDEWLARQPNVCNRIVIPKHLKLEVPDKLDRANITERVLYPGLDGLSLWLRRDYTQRPPPESQRKAKA
jgi:hypothetical protein